MSYIVCSFSFEVANTRESSCYQGVDAVTAAAQERKRKEEMAKQEAAVEVEDVPENDPFSSWAKTEDDLTRQQWLPLRLVEVLEGLAQVMGENELQSHTNVVHVLYCTNHDLSARLRMKKEHKNSRIGLFLWKTFDPFSSIYLNRLP